MKEKHRYTLSLGKSVVVEYYVSIISHLKLYFISLSVSVTTQILQEFYFVFYSETLLSPFEVSRSRTFVIVSTFCIIRDIIFQKTTMNNSVIRDFS